MAFSEFGMAGGSLNRASFVDNLVESPRGYASGPERGLLAALLFDGVQNFMNYACAESKDQRIRYSEAFNWVRRKGMDYVFSFDNVCIALGVDPEYLRIGLLNASNSQVFEWKKTRRNF